MKQVELYLVPYAKENEAKTRLVVDGIKIDSKDNRLTNLVVYQPMWKWLNPYQKKLFVWGGLLAEIIEEFNDNSFHFVFYGCRADFTLFKKSILAQQMKWNRNGGSVEVVFELIDNFNHKKVCKELIDVLDDLLVEADNWGEDAIMKEIEHLKSDICSCAVTLKTDYLPSSNELRNTLQSHNIGLIDDSVLTIIPVDESVSVPSLRHFLTSLIEENDADKTYMVINTSMRENETLFDAIVSHDSVNESGIKYIENDGETYIQEIVTVYYLTMLPVAAQRATKILHMFPDYDTNNFLIDISDRIDDLLCVSQT